MLLLTNLKIYSIGCRTVQKSEAGKAVRKLAKADLCYIGGKQVAKLSPAVIQKTKNLPDKLWT